VALWVHLSGHPYGVLGVIVLGLLCGWLALALVSFVSLVQLEQVDACLFFRAFGVARAWGGESLVGHGGDVRRVLDERGDCQCRLHCLVCHGYCFFVACSGDFIGSMVWLVCNVGW